MVGGMYYKWTSEGPLGAFDVGIVAVSGAGVGLEGHPDLRYNNGLGPAGTVLCNRIMTLLQTRRA